MDSKKEYISVSKAARMAGLTEKQVIGMCSQGGLMKLRHKKEGERILIERDSLTELFLGYTGGWD